MNARGSALLVAYYYPPATGIAADRLASFHRHLPKHGWSCHVVAPRHPHFHRTSFSQDAGSSDVHRTGSLELSRILRGAYRSLYGGVHAEAGPLELAPVRGGKGEGVLRQLVREWLYVPDAQLGWIPFAVRAGTRLIRSELPTPGVVFSSSVPYSAHLAAGRLATRFRIPWVAEFRDPWTLQDEALLPKTAFRRVVDRRIEEWIVRTADHLVVTSEATRDLYLEGLPFLDASEISVVPNGFEPLPPGTVPGPREAMTLVHAGTVQKEAYLHPLLASAARINTVQPGAVRVVAYGERDPWRRALAELGLGLPDWVELKGVVDPKVAAEAMQAASALLLFYPHPRFAKVIAGKLFAYIGARRPIVGVVPKGSEMARLIREAAQGWLVHDWDLQGIDATLEALLKKHRGGQLLAPMVSEDAIRPFTREVQALKLAKVFDRVVEAKWVRDEPKPVSAPPVPRRRPGA